MHYYQFNIADYRKDTTHLSMLEHGAYRQLLDWLYLSEQPIPRETEVVMRRLSARTEEEILAIQTVLNEMFELTENGYIQARCIEEIAIYHAKADRARDNGKRGGRPKKTKVVILDNPEETQAKANQEPLTINSLTKTNTTMSSLDEKPPVNDRVPYSEIVKIYHETLPKLPKVVMLTAKRKGQIAARWKSGVLPDLETWKDYFTHVGNSSFLLGLTTPTDGRKRFVADLEWLTNESNFTKVWEGKYHGA